MFIQGMGREVKRVVEGEEGRESREVEAGHEHVEGDGRIRRAQEQEGKSKRRAIRKGFASSAHLFLPLFHICVLLQVLFKKVF